MAEGTAPAPPPGSAWHAIGRRLDPAIVSAFGCIVLLLLLGSLYSSSFLSPEYLLQQLKVASFLGVIATGAMIVILLGQIDLSVPWVVAVGGMMSTAAAGWGALGPALAIPFGVGCGVLLGLLNGAGVAYLRLPSMIVTLAVNAIAQGLMVVHTGGFSPQDSSSPAMRFIATGHSVFGIPNALLVWAAIGAGAVFLLTRTTFGRVVYAIGNRERAAYLSGARTRLVVLATFALAGGLSAFGGVLLAGYASKAAQAMGDPYLLPAIAAVVLGGTSILGGRGNYLGTVAGVILITLLQSILSVTQIEEYGRHVIYGTVIIVMLLVYGRGRRASV
jgi:ribose transport system permease protein